MHAVLCLPISAYISLCLPQAGAQYQCMPPAVGAPCPDGTLAVATADLPERYTGALDFQRYISLCLPYIPLYLPYISPISPLYLPYISLYLPYISLYLPEMYTGALDFQRCASSPTLARSV